MAVAVADRCRNSWPTSDKEAPPDSVAEAALRRSRCAAGSTNAIAATNVGPISPSHRPRETNPHRWWRRFSPGSTTGIGARSGRFTRFAFRYAMLDGRTRPSAWSSKPGATIAPGLDDLHSGHLWTGRVKSVAKVVWRSSQFDSRFRSGVDLTMRRLRRPSPSELPLLTKPVTIRTSAPNENLAPPPCKRSGRPSGVLAGLLGE